MNHGQTNPARIGRWIALAAVLLAPAVALAEDATGHGAAEAGGVAEPSLFGGSIWMAVWSLAMFFLLLAVLGKFAWKPVVKMLQDREDRIAAALAESDRNRKAAEELLEQHRAKMSGAEAEAAKLFQQSQAAADEVRRQIVQQARTEAEDARKRAVEQIEASKDQAVASIFREAANVAATVAGQILQREVRPEDHERLVQQTLADLAKEKSRN
jgi:F-type H+-transporting ATPase subunit b